MAYLSEISLTDQEVGNNFGSVLDGRLAGDYIPFRSTPSGIETTI